ncbi:EpsG family protein [Acinetobacter bereziniae]|uniref:EpsG family protein n=1 Tax=Acinetobacter bereziniae TaxID=106648 RepID=UPI001C076CB8|nr:EpsG family protein [Acinetobacter bereziniae]
MSLKKVYAIFLFALSPIVGLLFLLHKLKRSQLNLLYVFVALLFSLMLFKSPPIDDLYRYLQLFDESSTYHISSIGDISSYTSFYFISKFYIFFGIPFFYIPFFYIFISIFFYLKSADIVFKKNEWSIKYYLFVLLGLLIIIDPILASLGLRFSAASAIFSYGVMLSLVDNNRKGFIYVFLSVFFHLSIIYLIIYFILSFFFIANKKTALILSIASLFLSGVFIKNAADYIPFVNISQQLLDYMDNRGTGYDPDAILGGSAIVVVFLARSKQIIFWILYYISPQLKDKRLGRFSNALNILSIGVCLSALTPIIFFRYAFGVLPLIYIFMSIVFYTYRSKLVLFFLLIYMTAQFLIVDLYIKKDSLLYGKPIQMIVFPIFQVVNYSDDDYRKHLRFIDEDGFYIK